MAAIPDVFDAEFGGTADGGVTDAQIVENLTTHCQAIANYEEKGGKREAEKALERIGTPESLRAVVEYLQTMRYA